MAEDSFYKKERMFFAIGLILICIGLVCNEWILGKLFSSDGILAIDTEVKIWGFDITLILTGFGLINYRKLKKTIVQFSQAHPTSVNFLIGLVFTVILLLGIKGIFYVLNYYQGKNIQEVYTGKLAQPDKLLGSKPRPNVKVSGTKQIDGTIIYSVTYTIDEYSRRVTPLENLEQRSKFILFFGDSFTFGEGVNDDETLPFYVSQFTARYKPYNYDFSGYGPEQMLARLEGSDITKEISESDGILIYTFLDHHVNRAIGSMYMYNNFGYADFYPYYVIDDKDRLIREGNFSSGRPISSFFYRMLGASQILQYFQLDFPRINDDHIKLTARIIEQARNTYRAKFNSDDFYVLFSPYYSGTLAKRLIPYFQNAHIKYLDYSNFLNGSGDKL